MSQLEQQSGINTCEYKSSVIEFLESRKAQGIPYSVSLNVLNEQGHALVRRTVERWKKEKGNQRSTEGSPESTTVEGSITHSTLTRALSA